MSLKNPAHISSKYIFFFNLKMWHNLDDEKIKYYISDNFVFRPNLAIFSFNKTLVQNTQSIKYPISLFSQSVGPFLEKINQKGSIIIIENRFSKLASIEDNVAKFYDMLGDYGKNIDFIAIFILSPNRYKKPNTNIFDKLIDIYAAHESKNAAEFDKEKSILIGSNAGRYSSEIFSSDESDIDRAFSHNLGIATFATPEHIFLNNNLPRTWVWKTPHVDKFLEAQKGKTEPEFATLFDTSYPKNLVFITGALSSGKTLLSRRLIDFVGAQIPQIPQSSLVDKLDIGDSNVGEICEAIDQFNNNELKFLFVVDVLYDDVFSKYSTIVNPLVKITYIELDSSRELCIFLDKFRLQITKSNTLLETKKEDIAKWFFTPKEKKDHVNYINFPLILRTREESFFRY